MTFYFSKYVFLLLLTGGLLSGCVTESQIYVDRGILTSGAHLSQGKRIDVQRFAKEDYVVFLVDLSWNNVDEDGGVHFIEWRWHKDDKLISKHDSKVLFKSTPVTLKATRAAATLGYGQFKIETFVDNKLTAYSTFEVIQ